MKKTVVCLLFLAMIAGGEVQAQEKVQTLQGGNVTLSTQAQENIENINKKLTEVKEDSDFDLARELDKIDIKQKAEVEAITLKIRRKADEDIAKGTEKARQKAEKEKLKTKEKYESKKLKARLKAESEINKIKHGEGALK